MTDKRRTPRKDLIFYSRVTDGNSGRMLGYLLNITPGGAMILSEKAVEPDWLVELHIELPEGLSDTRELVIPAHSLWCSPDINPEFYDCGFSFLDVSEEYVRLIHQMVAEYGFR